ncbi:MAG: 4-hydroxy-tetrahydrodipicolinate reductase, partial [Bacteroidales bacterium]|nr:4-hydroxy-tetrahydrodipicolinate reductase [Bacteroidales bacterium]
MKSLNIALLGYGKMGHIIESMAAKHGHKIACIIDNENDWHSTAESIWRKVDVAIEFSTPDTVVANIEKCFDINVPIVVGTTGWNAAAEQLRKRCEKENLSLFHSSNFSIGVYVFMQAARFLSEKIPSQYKPSISETHHIHKLDKPSGTALTLAHKAFDGGINSAGFTADTVPIESIRE